MHIPSGTSTEGSIACTFAKECSIIGQNSLGFLNRLFLVPKSNNCGDLSWNLSTLNKFLKKREIQNGNTRDNKDHVHKFQGCLLQYTHLKPVQEIPVFSLLGSVLPVQSTTNWCVHSFHGVQGGANKIKLIALQKGKNPSAPRQFVGKSQTPPKLSPAYTDSSSYLSGVRLVGKHGEVKNRGQGQIQLRAFSDLYCRDTGTVHRTDLPGLAIDVSNRGY